MAEGENLSADFFLGRVLGDLSGDVKVVVSEIKGIRSDMDTRHNENIARFKALEEKHGALVKRVDKLWMFRGRVLLAFTLCAGLGGLFIQMLADAAVSPIKHFIGWH